MRSLIEQELQAELVETFKDPNYRPPALPTVALQLSGLTRNDNAKIAYVVSLLERDAMLAGTVFRIVSSPLYASRVPITSLHQAVVRLGFKALRSVVFEAVLQRGIFDLPDYRETVEQLRRHSTTAAYIAKVVSQECGVDEDSAFLGGLLHDIGFSGLLFSISNQRQDASPRLATVWHDVDETHERASMLVSRLWALPEEICEIAGNHHHHERCADEATRKAAAAVCVGDWMTERFGANVVGPLDDDGTLIAADRVAPECLAAARALLAIDDERLQRIVEKAEAIVPEILWI